MKHRYGQKSKKVNKNSPWRKQHGGLGPLSKKHLPGVLDEESFETPDRLTKKDLETLL